MKNQSLAVAAFRLLLHLYPREFQQEYGRELTLVFRDRWTSTDGLLPRLFAICTAFGDLVAEGCAEHLRIAVRDLRLGWHAIRKDAVGSAIIVTTMALALGANTTMLGIADRLLLQPIAGVDQPSRLVRVYPNGYWTPLTRTWSDFLDLRDRSRAFAGVAAYRTDLVPVQADSTRKVKRDVVTPSYFDVLGAGAEAGRVFHEAIDGDNSEAPLAVISHRFWESEFGANRGAVGRSIRVAGVAVTIAGVAREEFRGVDPDPTMVWTLLEPLTRDRGNYQAVNVIGRLRPGLSVQEATQEANRANRLGWQEDGLPQKVDLMRLGALAVTQGPSAPKEIQVALWLTAASGIVLLAALLNITQLLVARALRRSRETAVHLALGASRVRLLRQWISESLLLAVMGGAAALLIAYMRAFGVYRLLLPQFAASFTWSLREAGLAAGLTMICGILTGLGAAWRGLRDGAEENLSQLGRHEGGRSQLVRSLMVTVQIGLTVVVLVGAVLFTRSLQRVFALDAGFALNRLLVVHLDTQAAGGLQDGRLETLYEGLAARTRELPGVVAAGLAHTVPGESSWRTRFYVAGRNADRFFEEGGGIVNRLSAFADVGAMSALQVRLVRGREFTAADRSGAEPVAIVNQQLAKEIWPGKEALGQCLHVLRADAPCTRVVGIVNNTRAENWFDAPPAQYYLPLAQPVRGERPSAILIRTAGAPDQSAALVQRELQKLTPSLVFVEVRPLAEALDPVVRPWKLGAEVFSALGLLALVITVVGVFGLLAYLVADRSWEWAVRQAMGATPVEVGMEVLAAMLRWVVPGLVLGVVLSLMLYRLLSSLLFRISPTDLSSYGTAVLLMAGITFVVALAPAARATRVDIAARLREE